MPPGPVLAAGLVVETTGKIWQIEHRVVAVTIDLLVFWLHSACSATSVPLFQKRWLRTCKKRVAYVIRFLLWLLKSACHSLTSRLSFNAQPAALDQWAAIGSLAVSVQM